MYFAITLLEKLNIEIHLVFTFQMIIFPFVCMSSASFVNPKCLLGEWAKYECKVLNIFSSRITKGSLDRLHYQIGVVGHTMDPNRMRYIISLICFVTLLLVL